MMAAALKVLQDRKVAMTCPELIDVTATGDDIPDVLGSHQQLIHSMVPSVMTVAK